MIFSDSNSWTIQTPIEQSIRRKIEGIGVPLKNWNIRINRGILTGFNDAFIIKAETKDQLIADDPKSAEIIRPILRGRDIKRYTINDSQLYLLFIPWHFPYHMDTSINGASEKAEQAFKEQYPAVYNHLLSYKEQLSNRNKAETGKRYEWYALQRWGAKYWDDFFKQKIVWGNLCLESQFAMASEDYFINAPSPMLVPGDYYLLAILNSIVADWYIRQLGVTRNGGYFEYKPMFVEQLPVPQIDDSLKDLYRSKAMEAEQNKTPETLDEINSMVFKLYNLSDEEIKYLKNQKV